MRNKTFGRSLLSVAFSRGIALLSSVAVGFLLPKMLSVSDYGFYKTFTLYAVYMALLHFGFVDGILLKLAGKDYNELDARVMRAYTRFFILFETAIFCILIAFGLIFAKGEYLFIVIMLAVNMLLVNLTTYYQFISQAVERFAEYSAKSVIASLIKLAFVVLLFVFYAFEICDVSYRWYLIGLNVIDLLMALWYVLIYRKITFGEGSAIRSILCDIRGIFATGIVLTAAYQVTHLVLALDRQFVNIFFSTEDFAVYSFAYNVVAMISTMISSLSVVLLPMLKKRSRDEVLLSYKKCLSAVSVISAFALICYFPLSAFIEWFLPEYVGSIEYIGIVLPAFAFTAVITIVMFTVAKVLDMSRDFFIASLIVLLLGVAANTAAYLIFGTPAAISYASLAVMAVWFIIAGARLKRATEIGAIKELCYLALVAAGFILLCKIFENGMFVFALYLAYLTAVTVLLYFKKIKKLMRAYFSSHKSK